MHANFQHMGLSHPVPPSPCELDGTCLPCFWPLCMHTNFSMIFYTVYSIYKEQRDKINVRKNKQMTSAHVWHQGEGADWSGNADGVGACMHVCVCVYMWVGMHIHMGV